MILNLTNKSQIPLEWRVLKCKRKDTVIIRSCQGVEKFKVSWQDSELISDPTLDLIIIQKNGKEYPCKRDVFFETYEPMPWSIDQLAQKYRKKTISTLVEIPEGYEVNILTLEGTLNSVKYPDYIVVGIKDELYANSKEFVDENLEIIEILKTCPICLHVYNDSESICSKCQN